MPIYEYKALDNRQKSKKGIIDADSPREARIQLKKKALYVTDIAETQKKERRGLKIKGVTGVEFPNKYRSEQIAQVTRQMSSLLRAGIPLAEVLRMVIEQAPDKQLEATFRDIREKVTQGATLGDACQMHPAYFSELYANMVRAGESSGALDRVMTRLADFLQAQARLKNKVGAAMIYPTIMVIVGVIVVSILMTAVVPKITQLIRGKGDELPTLTRGLVAVSDFMVEYWPFLLIGALVLMITSQLLINTKRGREVWDRVKLNMPVFGDLQRKQAVARFSTTLSTLLRSGVPAMQALLVTKKVLENVVLQDAIQSVHDQVLEGTDLATPMKNSDVFPPTVCYMVGVGEQAGNLEEMLERVAESYDEEVELATEKLTKVLEPLIIVALAVVVAVIVIAVVMPLVQLQQVN